MGMRPGSDYLLLARMPGGEGAIKSFDLLQRKCPKANVRNAGNIDIAYTRYCAINSRQELVSLAKRMARLKQIGTMALVPKEEGKDHARSEERRVGKEWVSTCGTRWSPD